MNKQLVFFAVGGRKPYDRPMIEHVVLNEENILCTSGGIQTEPYEDGEFNW